MPDALAAKKKRWALVYPNFEYGQSAAAAFKEMIKAQQPDVEFVTEQATPLGKIDAGAVVQAIDDAKPDAIFSALFGADLAKFVREGNTRGVFKDRFVVDLLAGEPEYLDPLKDEAPVGWIVTGYPWYADRHAARTRRSLPPTSKRYNDYPRLGSVVGYLTMKSLAAGIAKAGSTDTEKLVEAFARPEGGRPVRPVRLPRQRPPGDDGRLSSASSRSKDGKGTMVDFKYVDGATVLPLGRRGRRRLRPASAD